MPETPMAKQYQAIKSQYPNMLVLFRMGDFYEMFYEDAEIASQMLGITLTSRNKGENVMPMAGIPAKALETYLPKIIAKQGKVAICEQTQDPSEAQGLVERNVVRIITPGTLTEQEVLYAKGNNFILSITLGKKVVGLAWADISTGQFIIHEIQPDKLYDEMNRLSPAECLISENSRDIQLTSSEGLLTLEGMLVLQQVSITTKPDWYFDSNTGERMLQQHFRVKTLESYGCQDMKQAIGAAGALVKYLGETQKGDLRNIEHIEIYNAQEIMFLDRATRNCLEIQKTMREGSKRGSLIDVLDKTSTAMGSRLLATWMSNPLVNRSKIQERQDIIQELSQNRDTNNRIRNILNTIQDIERLCARIAYQRANARDLLAIKTSLQTLPELCAMIQHLHSPLIQEIAKQINISEEIAILLEKAIHLQPEVSLKEGGIIRDGFSTKLDELRQLQNSGNEWIKNFEKREIAKTEIPSLKVGFTSVFGYYIEITHTHINKVPKHYIRKQTLKNAERYITTELKEYEEKALSASQRANTLEYQLFIEIREKISQSLSNLQKTAHAIAILDVLSNFTYIALEYKYVRPDITDDYEIKIIGGRHPVLSATKPSFVPNDIYINSGNTIAIITGPNMAGKSTYIRQVALLILLAQVGSFIPCESAQIGLVDRIFTRIGAHDELTRDRSTFMVEMIETASILHSATDRSFIALDEVGRGTSTFDGISLAWAIVEHIQKNIGARTVFATHYHEMTEMSEVYPNIHNYSVAIQERGDDITFLYKIIPGSTDKSYGIHVARLAGIHKDVIKRSREILTNLQKHAIDFQTYTKGCLRSSSSKSLDNLFSMVGEDILTTLANIDLNNLSPMEAFQILKDMQIEAKRTLGKEA